MQRSARLLMVIALAAMLLGTAGGAAAVMLARPPAAAPETPITINGSLGSSITVQGRLEDGGGVADGSFDFRLWLYDAANAGTQVGSTVTFQDVIVTDGLFTLSPDFGNVFDGSELWLAIGVRPGTATGAFTLLGPRHALTGAPYALGLRPGIVVDTDDAANIGYILSLTNDSAAAEADAIKAYSTNGEGVEGYSTGDSVADSGVYGQSNGTGSGDAGVRGYASGAGPGFYGQGVGSASTSYGVLGVSSVTHGVYGESNASSTTYFGGYFVGPKGVYGNAENTSGDGSYGYCSAGTSCWGARGNSVDSYGVQGNTSRSDHMYGLHTSDMVYAGSGYDSVAGLSLIAQNGGEAALDVGDVVVAAGIGTPFEDQASTPMLAVRQADGASAGSVVGVVERVIRVDMVPKLEVVYQETAIPDPEGQEADDVQWLAAEEQLVEVPMLQAIDGPAVSGDYVVIRVQGLAQMKVDASAAAIAIGAPLVAGDNGAAIQADPAGLQNSGEHALIVGQALEPLADGRGLIWVLVNPR